MEMRLRYFIHQSEEPPSQFTSPFFYCPASKYLQISISLAVMVCDIGLLVFDILVRQQSCFEMALLWLLTVAVIMNLDRFLVFFIELCSSNLNGMSALPHLIYFMRLWSLTRLSHFVVYVKWRPFREVWTSTHHCYSVGNVICIEMRIAEVHFVSCLGSLSANLRSKVDAIFKSRTRDRIST